MQRREFLKLLCATGVAASVAPMWLRAAESQTDAYQGPLLLFIQAMGGWDSMQFFDPKGSSGRGFSGDEIEDAGGLRYPPLSWQSDAADVFWYAGDFFPAYHQRSIVVHGLNMQTNAHQPGVANSFQGSFSTGFPTLAASFCAAHAPDLLMGYLVTGEYRSTGELVPYTAISEANMLRAVANPNSADGLPNNLPSRHIPSDVLNIVERAREARVRQLLEDTTQAPRRRRMLHHLSSSINGAAGIERLGEMLPDDGLASLDERMIQNPLVNQADVALHAMAAGLTASVDMQMPGNRFDSHADNNPRQREMFAQLVYGLRFLWQRAETIDSRHGTNLAGRLTVVVASEFGRTPHFNSGNGTDHWPTTSALIMKKDYEHNGLGSRTVGFTTNDGRYRPGRINPESLQPDDYGVEMTGAHLHAALRDHLHVSGAPALARFSLEEVERVRIFTPNVSTEQA